MRRLLPAAGLLAGCLTVWAIPVAADDPPAVKDAAWAEMVVDRFLLAALEANMNIQQTAAAILASRSSLYLGAATAAEL